MDPRGGVVRDRRRATAELQVVGDGILAPFSSPFWGRGAAVKAIRGLYRGHARVEGCLGREVTLHRVLNCTT